MTSPAAPKRFVSFDGGVALDGHHLRPEHYRFFDPARFPAAPIPRGAGLSYAAASFADGAHTIDHAAFSRILAFSPADRTVTVEAGTTLGALAAFTLPRGLYLAVQPGHPVITVGGCVAADVHGKNHFRDGTFLSQVLSLTLFHPAAGTLTLSPQHDPDLFQLTCGGYGLTGNILSVTLRLQSIPSPVVRVHAQPVDDLLQLPHLLAAASQSADLVYTWHDFTRTGDAFGRGVLTSGTFATDLPPSGPIAIPPPNPLSADTRGNWRAPFFNPFTTAPFNRLYGTALRRSRPRLVPLYAFLFPVHDKQAYFKLFGRPGFFEFQHVIPTARFPDYVAAVRQRLARHPLPVTLASAKLFRGQQDLLRFSGTGICMAINLPRSAGALDFARFLDDLLPDLGAIPNIIKDSRLPQSVVARAYPEYETFRDRLRTFDPHRLYRSELSQRLQL
jgi:decaprenylphospho-beta-D-ribofuranose 2-oxidase